jgi:hypothetical protein
MRHSFFRTNPKFQSIISYQRAIMRGHKTKQPGPPGASHAKSGGKGRLTAGPGLKLNVIQERTEKEKEPVQISLLQNSLYYFIESVFIMKDQSIQGYTLVVIHQKKALWIKNYKTTKGARRAFLKRFGYKAWREGVRPDWTKFYPPEPDWLEEKLNAEMDY